MQLVYLDESGNTGTNFNDAEQPVFVLCALIVAESSWQGLESDLREALDRRIPKWRELDDFEVHAAELRSGNGHFHGMSPTDRIALRDEWMKIAIKHGVQLVSQEVDKKKYAVWLQQQFGGGIIIHPYVAAFALLSRCIDNHLAKSGSMGILIVDENKEIVGDIEKSISFFRTGATGPLRFNRIIEKGFFIESHKSLPLQLCDLFVLSIRKGLENSAFNKPTKSVDASGIKLAHSIRLEDHIHDGDVMAWLIKNHAPSGSPVISSAAVSPEMKIAYSTDETIRIVSPIRKIPEAHKNSGQGINPESTDVGP